MNRILDIPQVNTQDIYHCEYCAHQRFETGRGAYCKILPSGRVKGECNFFEKDDIHLKMKKLVREERRAHSQRKYYFALNVGNVAVIVGLLLAIIFYGEAIMDKFELASGKRVYFIFGGISTGTQTLSFFKYRDIRRKHIALEEKLDKAVAILSNYGEVKYGKERLRG
ncbi:hypothetical protein [Phaeocystidibacter luteus]|uniref:Uncharacterized protein n=1 Tax=Phaeocystidibacter luteus TaxID=911197 RepID=A0A6N6RL27_9FLAO|nr:hypothetical protein [Phaeocystidibacter luteus]KAB2810197.1 hypothetical protein F8C67_08155 [Phaeocystidibacter luteus]